MVTAETLKTWRIDVQEIVEKESKPVASGTVDIPAGEPYTLTVKAESIAEAYLMNLQKDVLVPSSSNVLR